MSLIKTDKKIDIVDRCQLRLWETLKELESYSVLFSNVSGSDFKGESLYGVGIRLKHLSARLDRVNDMLSKLLDRDKTE